MLHLLRFTSLSLFITSCLFLGGCASEAPAPYDADAEAADMADAENMEDDTADEDLEEDDL